MPKTRTDDPHPLIRRLRAMGMTESVILTRMRAEGWSAEALAPALGAQPVPTPASAKPAAPRRVHPEAHQHALQTLGVVGAAAALSLGGFFLFRPPASTVAAASATPAHHDAVVMSSFATAALADAATTTEATSSFAYELRVPHVSADEYLVADVDTDETLASKDPDQQAQIASITKLVAALVVDDHLDRDAIITVPQDALVYTAVPRLKAGEKVSVNDLLFLLLQESSNEASEVLASGVGRDEFLGDMNAKAQQIGLAHTSFYDPSGAKEDMSTPQDLLTLLKFVQESDPFVFSLTTGALTDLRWGALNDFNIIKGAPGTLVGGKIGQTNAAGETYAGIFSVTVGGQSRQIAVIVLGSTNVEKDVVTLLQFVKNSYAPAG